MEFRLPYKQRSLIVRFLRDIGYAQGVWYVIALVLMSGCSPSTQFVNKHFSTQSTKVTTVLFPLAKDIITVYDPGEVYEDFKSDKREASSILIDSGYAAMKKSFKDSLRNAEILEFVDNFNKDLYLNDASIFFTVKQAIGKDSLIYEFQVPKEEYVLKHVKSCDIIIVVNKITISERSIQYMDYLNSRVKYITWDYRKSEIVSCGEFDLGYGYLFMKSQKTWIGALGMIGGELARLGSVKGKRF
jgi:hypothetical protein